MHVRFTQIKERVAAATGYLLLAKALLCAVSVVEGRSCSKRSRYKPCTKRGKCFCGYSLPTALFGKSMLLVVVALQQLQLFQSAFSPFVCASTCCTSWSSVISSGISVTSSTDAGSVLDTSASTVSTRLLTKIPSPLLGRSPHLHVQSEWL